MSIRRLSGQPQPDGSIVYRTNLTPVAHTGEVVVPYDKHRVIPVILIPGILATRLKLKDTDRNVWDPPNTRWEKFTTFLEYLFKSTKTRVAELDPKTTEVDDSMPENTALTEKSPERQASRKERGWGALYGKSYHPFMESIENTLNSWKQGAGSEVP